jgi:hypothetical protein
MAAVKAKQISKKTAKRAAATKAVRIAKPRPIAAAGKKPRFFTISFASVYPLYVRKAERKGRTRAEVDQVIAWLTGYQGASLQRAIDDEVDFETFFASAPRFNPHAGLITGVVCGVRVEEV